MELSLSLFIFTSLQKHMSPKCNMMYSNFHIADISFCGFSPLMSSISTKSWCYFFLRLLLDFFLLWFYYEKCISPSISSNNPYSPVCRRKFIDSLLIRRSKLSHIGPNSFLHLWTYNIKVRYDTSFFLTLIDHWSRHSYAYLLSSLWRISMLQTLCFGNWDSNRNDINNIKDQRPMWIFV